MLEVHSWGTKFLEMFEQTTRALLMKGCLPLAAGLRRDLAHERRNFVQLLESLKEPVGGMTSRL